MRFAEYLAELFVWIIVTMIVVTLGVVFVLGAFAACKWAVLSALGWAA
jgi:hypothetical protein